MINTKRALVLGVGVTLLSAGLTGCGMYSSSTSATATGAGSAGSLSHVSFTGSVFGGQQPVIGAAIQLYAVGGSGLGSAATALIPVGDQVVYSGANTGALTDSTGNFRITGDYTCPATSPQVYLVSTGGTSQGSGGSVNSAITMMAPLGDCATLVANASTTYVQINELVTAAAVYALAPFMTDYAHVGAASVQAPGLVNAVKNFNNLVNLATGGAGGASLPTGATVPTAELNTLGNMLAACVNSATSTSTLCSGTGGLLSTTGASETIGAMLVIAKDPGNANYTALFGLGSAQAPFQTAYSSQPNDFTVAIKYTAAGGLSTPYGIAIDASGNAYVTNAGGSSVVELSPTGAVLATLTGGGLIGAKGIAIDRTANGANIWVANPSQNSIVKFNSSGVLQSGSTGYTAGSLNGPASIALDSAGNVWIANLTGNSVSELSSAGAATLSAVTAGSTISSPTGIALDSTGNVYVANNGGGNVVKLTSAGVAATGSPFTDLALQGTSAVAVDTSGNVFAPGSTTGAAVVGALSQFASSGSATSASPFSAGGLSLPVGVATSGTTGWITNGVTSGSLSQVVAGASSAKSPSTGFGSLNTPVGVAVDISGNVWTANSGDNTVSVFIGLTAPVVTPIAANVGP